MLELDKLEFWGDKQLIPMLLIDEGQNIVWFNRWAVWLFQVNLDNMNLRQLQAGDRLANYLAKVKEHNTPSLTESNVNGLHLDIEARPLASDSSYWILKFHTKYLTRPTMLEMHKFMQDFALEAGDRVNNPLTTVLNCLNMIQRGLRLDNAEKLETYVEMAIREAHVMQEFGNWVRRLSAEPPFDEDFNLIPVLEDVLDRRNCLHHLTVQGDIPHVQGSAEHAAMVLGGLVNLMRQASNDTVFTVKVACQDKRLVTVDIDSSQARVKDIRMLFEEFYGGLGLLAARYLLSLMQAQLELEFMGDIGIRVTFVSSPGMFKANPGK